MHGPCIQIELKEFREFQCHLSLYLDRSELVSTPVLYRPTQNTRAFRFHNGHVHFDFGIQPLTRITVEMCLACILQMGGLADDNLDLDVEAETQANEEDDDCT